uniref:Uncharacterized protein n=1 Tax=Taeniopygia guttata TaxID=59729 RepID=H0ZZE2_TAEGU
MLLDTKSQKASLVNKGITLKEIDELTCPVCLEYFNDPVLVAECGHNFCRACVTQCWEDSARRLCCPQCREPVPQRLFRPNRSLGNIVHIVRQLGLPPGPSRCPRHGEPLRLYCVQDRRAVCVVCHLSREHRAHTVLPAEEAAHAAEKWTPSLVLRKGPHPWSFFYFWGAASPPKKWTPSLVFFFGDHIFFGERDPIPGLFFLEITFYFWGAASPP